MNETNGQNSNYLAKIKAISGVVSIVMVILGIVWITAQTYLRVSFTIEKLEELTIDVKAQTEIQKQMNLDINTLQMEVKGIRSDILRLEKQLQSK